MVPINLPKYSESYDECDLNIVKDLQEFVDKFEWVLKVHEIDVNTSWKWLLPLVLGSIGANWVEGNLIDKPEIINWAQAKEAILSHYQNPQWKAMLMMEL